VLETTLGELKSGRYKKKNEDLDPEVINDLSKDSIYNYSFVPTATDLEVATPFFPLLMLSSGALFGGVDLRDENYLYQDYLPINFVDITTSADLPTLCLTERYNETPPGQYPINRNWISRLGDGTLKTNTNSIDFLSMWEPPSNNLCTDRGNPSASTAMKNAYRGLNHTTTYYYRVFRDSNQNLPTAVQVWFFYFYNDWVGRATNHPGDWETITIFLDPVGDPKEVSYSTHYEANRHSFNKIETWGTTTHPIVYVSNGGHGSYVSGGETSGYCSNFSCDIVGGVCGIDFHSGNREPVYASMRVDIAVLENNPLSTIWFEGRSGDIYSAPRGPRKRTDAPTECDWMRGANPPLSPDTCTPRFGNSAALIYGNADTPNDPDPSRYYGPWKWASGYGLDGVPCGL
jgi:hypothetical protein